MDPPDHQFIARNSAHDTGVSCETAPICAVLMSDISSTGCLGDIGREMVTRVAPWGVH